MIQGIIFDLDGTLYDYDCNHKRACTCIFSFVAKTTDLNYQEIEIYFESVKKSVKNTLSGTGASHNRFLYFQLLVEKLKLPYSLVPQLYNLYWDTFLEQIALYEGVLPLLKKLKENNIQIGLLTDLTVHIQFRKLEKLGIHDFFDAIVSSEEAGVEKPHPFGFLLLLDKLKLNKRDVAMVGDSYSKDCLGALNLEIPAYLLSQNAKDNVIVFKNYAELFSLL